GDLARLVTVFGNGDWDLVMGSRVLGDPEPGSLTPLQRFGNWVATRLMRWIWGVSYTDLGPLRVLGTDALRRRNLRDPDLGYLGRPCAAGDGVWKRRLGPCHGLAGPRRS